MGVFMSLCSDNLSSEPRKRQAVLPVGREAYATAHAEASLRSAFQAEQRLLGSGFWNASTPTLLVEPIASSRNAQVWPRSELGAKPPPRVPMLQSWEPWMPDSSASTGQSGQKTQITVPCVRQQPNGRPAQGLSPASCPWGLFPICFLTKQKVEKPPNSYCRPKS